MSKSPQQEERAIKAKIANLAKAREARTAAARKRRWDEIWPGIVATAKRTSCTCNLRKGMSNADIRALGGGCRAQPFNGLAGSQVRYVCPVLDQLRLAL